MREKTHYPIPEENFFKNLQRKLYHLKPPCSKCPYRLGTIRMPKCPCSECRKNGYRTFEEFQKPAFSGKG